MRYERIPNADSAVSIDETKVYNAEQIHDQASIIDNDNFDFDQFFFSDFSWQNIFKDSEDTKQRKRLCIGILSFVICVLIILLCVLFLGFAEVMLGIISNQEKSRHGLMMIPNIRKRSLNVLYYNVNNETANAEYGNEIDKFLNQYAKKQEMLEEYLDNCTTQKGNDKKRLCAFDIKKQFHPDCSKLTNYGYNSGNPCVLFIFNDNLDWKPNMKSDMDYLPFVCHMEFQYTNTRINITYYPSLSTAKDRGGFQMNLIPSQKITDKNGKGIVGKDGNVLYTLPPMVMVKMSLRDLLKQNKNNFNEDFDDNLVPFTMNCQIENNFGRYQFDNINDFNGHTVISFDFAPYFP